MITDLNEANKEFDWQCHSLLSNGQFVGKSLPGMYEKAFNDKTIIEKINNLIDLSDKTCLEVACCEGLYTLILCDYCKSVDATDARPENVQKTIHRLFFHKKYAKVYELKCENINNYYDIIYHSGVFYHLINPIEHLFKLRNFCNYLYLETHYENDVKKCIKFKFDKKFYYIKKKSNNLKKNKRSAFYGIYDYEILLYKKSLFDLITNCKFEIIDIFKVKKLEGKKRKPKGERIGILLK